MSKDIGQRDGSPTKEAVNTGPYGRVAPCLGEKASGFTGSLGKAFRASVDDHAVRLSCHTPSTPDANPVQRLDAAVGVGEAVRMAQLAAIAIDMKARRSPCWPILPGKDILRAMHCRRCNSHLGAWPLLGRAMHLLLNGDPAVFKEFQAKRNAILRRRDDNAGQLKLF